MTEIDILKKNVHDLQEQLNAAHKRIATLNEEWSELRDKLDAANKHNKSLTQSLCNAYDDISNMLEEDTNATQRTTRTC